MTCHRRMRRLGSLRTYRSYCLAEMSSVAPPPPAKHHHDYRWRTQWTAFCCGEGWRQRARPPGYVTKSKPSGRFHGYLALPLTRVCHLVTDKTSGSFRVDMKQRRIVQLRCKRFSKLFYISPRGKHSGIPTIFPFSVVIHSHPNDAMRVYLSQFMDIIYLSLLLNN